MHSAKCAGGSIPTTSKNVQCSIVNTLTIVEAFVSLSVEVLFLHSGIDVQARCEAIKMACIALRCVIDARPDVQSN